MASFFFLQNWEWKLFAKHLPQARAMKVKMNVRKIGSNFQNHHFCETLQLFINKYFLFSVNVSYSNLLSRDKWILFWWQICIGSSCTCKVCWCFVRLINICGSFESAPKRQFLNACWWFLPILWPARKPPSHWKKWWRAWTPRRPWSSDCTIHSTRKQFLSISPTRSGIK